MGSLLDPSGCTVRIRPTLGAGSPACTIASAAPRTLAKALKPVAGSHACTGLPARLTPNADECPQTLQGFQHPHYQVSSLRLPDRPARTLFIYGPQPRLSFLLHHLPTRKGHIPSGWLARPWAPWINLISPPVVRASHLEVSLLNMSAPSPAGWALGVLSHTG